MGCCNEDKNFVRIFDASGNRFDMALERDGGVAYYAPAVAATVPSRDNSTRLDYKEFTVPLTLHSDLVTDMKRCYMQERFGFDLDMYGFDLVVRGDVLSDGFWVETVGTDVTLIFERAVNGGPWKVVDKKFVGSDVKTMVSFQDFISTFLIASQSTRYDWRVCFVASDDTGSVLFGDGMFRVNLEYRNSESNIVV